MSLPHRLIIDGVEQCASDDKKEFQRLAIQYLYDLGRNVQTLTKEEIELLVKVWKEDKRVNGR